MQADCASQNIHDGRCSACNASMARNDLHEISGDSKVAVLKLQGQTVATVMRCAQNALAFANYQKSICAAKKRQLQKRRVKNILEISKQKIQQFLEGYKKVRAKCEQTMLIHAEAEEERASLEQYFENKATKVKALQAHIKRLRAESVAVMSEVGSDVISDDGWFETTLEHEVKPGVIHISCQCFANIGLRPFMQMVASTCHPVTMGIQVLHQVWQSTISCPSGLTVVVAVAKSPIITMPRLFSWLTKESGHCLYEVSYAGMSLPFKQFA